MIIGISGYINSGKDTVAKMIQYHAFCARYGYNISDGFRNDSSRDYSGAGWEIKKFAYKLKQIASILTGIPVKDFEKQEVKDSFLPKEWDKFILQVVDHPTKATDYVETPTTVRQLLQALGTEAVRDHVHTNAWVNALFADYKPVGGMPKLSEGKEYMANLLKYPNWIISDMRFPNEFDAIKERGGITIRVNRKYICKDPNIVKPEHLEHGINLDLPQLRHSSETSLDNHDFDYTINNSGDLDDLLNRVKEIYLSIKADMP